MAGRREFWRELIAEFDLSQESQRSFAESHNVSLGTFRYWLYRLRAEDATGTKDENPSSHPLETGLPQIRKLAAELQRTQKRLELIEKRAEANNLVSNLQELSEDVARLRQEVFVLSESRSAEEDVYTRMEATDLESGYLTHEEQSERDLVDTLLSDPNFKEPLVLDDFNERLTAIESALTDVEDGNYELNCWVEDSLKTATEAMQEQVKNLFHEHAMIIDEVTEMQQEFHSYSFEDGNLIADELTERQFIDALRSDPPATEKILLEELDQRITLIENTWKNLEEGDLLAGLHHRLQKVEYFLAANRQGPTLRQIEKRILAAQERGRQLVHSPLKFDITADELCASLRRVGYFLSQTTAADILHQLQIRRILVLQGPPGTGKSKLARLLPQFLISGADSTAYTEASMRPEASSFHVIGGLRSYGNYGKRFGPHLGYLSEAVLRSIESNGKHWLILDEINRGDISASLSPCLDGLNLDVGTLDHDHLFMTRSNTRGSIPIPGNFRIIGTMNTFDEDQLFRFSEALSRRTGFVHLAPLPPMDERVLAEDLIFSPSILGMNRNDEALDTFKRNLDRASDYIFEIIGQVRGLSQREPRHIFRYCEVGTAVVLDILRQICLRLANNPENKAENIADQAVASIFLSHLAGRDLEVLEALKNEVFTTQAFPHCRQLIDRKITDLQIF